LRATGGDMEEAKKRFAATTIWREDYKVDEVLTEHQPYFDEIKRFYPHYIHGRAKGGQIIYIEQIG